MKLENEISNLELLIENGADISTIKEQARLCMKKLAEIKGTSDYEKFSEQYNNLIKYYNKTVKEKRKNLKEDIKSRENILIQALEPDWDKWCEKSFMCYSVKELAYEISYRVLDLLNKNDGNEIYIGYKFYDGKHKVIFEIDNYTIGDGEQKKDVSIFLSFDIWWQSGFFDPNSSALRIGNGQLKMKIPQGYEDIEDVLRDEEEEE